MTRVALLPVAAACCFAALASAQTPTYSVQIGGLTQPTAFAWDTTNMRVYAGNKAGQIFMATWNSTAFPSRFPSTPILDLSWKVASYGDLGLSALDVNSGYLYVAYNNQSQWGATGCTANGVIGNQNIGAMVGCPTGGVVSRFQLDAATGAIAAGAQENTIIALNLANFCTQFSELNARTFQSAFGLGFARNRYRYLLHTFLPFLFRFIFCRKVQHRCRQGHQRHGARSQRRRRLQRGFVRRGCYSA